MSEAREFAPTGDMPVTTRLLEASAGTGKTYTITSLVLRAVAELGIPLEQLLVVTFTRAAASELRGRIRTRLADAASALATAAAQATAVEQTGTAQTGTEQTGTEQQPDGHDPDLAEEAGSDEVIRHLIAGAGAEQLAQRARRLRTARESIDQATIDTIHGFCHAALVRAAPDAAIDLGVELAEDLTELIDELVHDTLVRELRDADDAWFALLTDRGVSPARLRRIAAMLESEPTLRVVPEPLLASDGSTAEPAVLWAQVFGRFTAAWQAQGTALVDWLVSHAKDGFEGTYYNRSRPGKEAEAITAWCEAGPPALGDLTGIDKRLAYVARSTMQDKARHTEAIPGHLDVIDAADALLALPDALATDVLVRFAVRARDELHRRKQARGVLSFSDLLLRLDDALTQGPGAEAVRAAVRSRFTMALIDEFQDTDPVQWRIFDRLFGADARLELIGDPKQAIYAFRGADVGTYLEVVASIADEQRFTLSTNYRSDARYLQALTELLDRPELEPDGVFDVERIQFRSVRASQRHQHDRLRFDDGPRPALEIRFLPRALLTEDGEEPTRITKGRGEPLLGRIVADEIVTLLEQAPQIHEGDAAPRAVAPQDLAVLVRTNRQAEQVHAALLRVGVPAVIESAESVLRSPEATVVQRLLDALLRPADERSARPALLGPVIGIEAAALDGADETDWDTWIEQLAGWARCWRADGIAAALSRILDDRATAVRVLAQPRGERVMTNLRHLRELLHDAETAERLGPERLAAWLREQRHATGATAEQRELRLESDADAVTVTTVHRAKGLQYGIVWCPFLWDARRRGPDDTAILRFRDPATGELCLDVSGKDTAAKRQHLGAADRDDWQEALRLLYVALTRAEHRCVVHTGGFSTLGRSPLARVLHGLGLGSPESDDADLAARSDDELRLELDLLTSDVVGLSEVDALPGERRWTPPATSPQPLQIRRFDRALDRRWQRTSFSRLTAGEHQPAQGTPRDEGIDHDDGVLRDGQSLRQAESATTDGAVQSAGSGGAGAGVAGAGGAAEGDAARDAAALALASFPRGIDAGTLLHAVFEHVDFDADDAALASVLDEQSRRFGLDVMDRDAAVSGFGAALRTPLGPLFDERCLADIRRVDRLDELTFDLPLAGGSSPGAAEVSLGAIAEVVAAYPQTDTLPTAAFARRLRGHADHGVRGFLTGSIDLVARFDGRYLVADYKSNWLGRGDALTLGDYHPDRVVTAMLDGDYLLQALLYLVALHRLLRSRMRDAYDYDRDVAGFAYLFVRGMTGPSTPRDAAGTPYGIFAARPPLALVEDLDALLREGR